MRIFAGLPVPERASQSIAAWVAPSRSGGGPLRWVDPSLYHLTLHFFGEVAADRVEELAEDLLHMSAKPIAASFGAAGTFGRPPRVLHLEVRKGGDKIIALQGAYAERISGLGYQLESRPYVPHLTLARLPRGHGSLRVPNTTVECSCTLDHVVLYQSRSGSTGPVYVPIETLILEEADR